MNILLNPWLIAAAAIGVTAIICTLLGVRTPVIGAMFVLVIIIGMRGTPPVPPASTLHMGCVILIIALMALVLTKRKKASVELSHN